MNKENNIEKTSQKPYRGYQGNAQGLTAAHRGPQGRTRGDRGPQWDTEDGYRGAEGMTGVYSGSLQWHTGDVQGMTVKTQAVTGEDGGFSYGQRFLEPVV